MTKNAVALLSAAAAAVFAVAPSATSAYTPTVNQGAGAKGEGRRAFLGNAASALVAAAAAGGGGVVSTLAAPAPALAATEGPLADVYFGVGCFWHIQHEFVEAERRLLGRSDDRLTSRTGYAGGTRTD
eukprot:CAMPEP_0183303442 /NCGR_PEP_ID=MMETSP0160_2-20130417/8881_1 /TAXON_ID=2839 ORGANISM="Odontella Sinensis, Strain Grunow 1884" /NCGR_SAMPLE_ID=MMETSP0160_2 /ASSEMBLY_ACC=CAM_ASM_000250 /LENGTH=127 /DNA_ID=CAMNT_0025466349 /DNA_START=59 /DNA_END=439 /DNA_ORIENTATION=+